MKLVDSLASFLGYEKKGTLEEGTLPNLYSFSRQQSQLGLQELGVSKQKLLKEYRSFVYACVDARAKEVAGARLIINASTSQTTIREVRQSHPLVQLLDRPNPFMTKYELLYMIEAHLCLTGNAYLYTPRNRIGAKAEIWILRPDRMQIVPDENTFISGYILKADNEKDDISLLPDEVCHIKLPNPLSAYYGIGPLEAAAGEVDIANFQREYQRNFYKNFAVPEFALKTEQELGQTAMKRLKKDWQRAYEGASKRGKIAVLEKGLSIEKIGVSPKDLDWLANNKATLMSIASIFRVPPSKLGHEDVPNRAVAEASNYSFSRNVIDPSLHFITGRMTLDIAKDFDQRLKIDFESTVKDDEERKARIRNINLVTGVTNINEEREEIGFDPVEGGDINRIPAGYKPLNQPDKDSNDEENIPPPPPDSDDAGSESGSDE